MDFFTRPVAVVTPAIRMPMIMMTAESSIRVKALEEFLNIKEGNYFSEEIFGYKMKIKGSKQDSSFLTSFNIGFLPDLSQPPISVFQTQ